MLKTITKVAKFTDKVTGSKSTKLVINLTIKDYGDMIEFKLDHNKKNLYAKILLKGEDTPIELNIERYQIDIDLGYIKILSANTSKEWLDAILNNFIINKPINVPKDKLLLIEQFLA